MTQSVAHNNDFDEVVQLIEAARQRVNRAVNTELIDLYWTVGEYVSREYVGFRLKISGVCGSFLRHIALNQNSQHC